jgi:hypothetical protein
MPRDSGIDWQGMTMSHFDEMPTRPVGFQDPFAFIVPNLQKRRVDD